MLIFAQKMYFGAQRKEKYQDFPHFFKRGIVEGWEGL
jgi:hypothetical protein